MTMLSFRVSERAAEELQDWADARGIARSELLREALLSYIRKLQSELDAAVWEERPASAAEMSLSEVTDWGPAEDWSDWDAAR